MTVSPMSAVLNAAAHSSVATIATAPAPDDTYILWGGVLFGIALLLILIEIFVPSGGLLGLLAAVALVGSIVAFFVYDTTWGITALLLDLVMIPIVIIFGFKVWMNSSFGRRIVLGGTTEPMDDPEGAAARAERARRERVAQLEVLIGAHGVTETPLRPVGTVRIAGQRVDAMAEGTIIGAGVDVVVTTVYDNQIKVRERRADEPADVDDTPTE